MIGPADPTDRRAAALRWIRRVAAELVIGTADPADRRAAALRAALCVATALMIGLSWPLWAEPGSFPRVPFVAGWPSPPGVATRVIVAATLAALGLAAIGVDHRKMLGIALTGMGFEVLGDQGRFQPWAYQFGVVGLALATMPAAWSLRAARWYAASLYVYSGLSKLDAAFVAGPGRMFLDAGLGLFGATAAGWPVAARGAAILAMPAFELGVGVALGFGGPAWRRAGLAGLIAIHAALIATLGPWALGHSPNVLAWNAAMAVEGWILFARPPDPTPPVAATLRARPASALGWAAIVAALALPACERWGLCDPWPAHALYAAHPAMAEVELLDDDRDLYPESIRRHLAPAGPSPWRRLDLTAWSLAARGVPIYPGPRVPTAIAAWLARRYGEVRLVTQGPADLATGRRERAESLGLPAIVRAAGRYWLNARAAP